MEQQCAQEPDAANAIRRSIRACGKGQAWHAGIVAVLEGASVSQARGVYRFFSPIKSTEFVELSNQVVPVLGANSRNQLTYAGHDLSRIHVQASRDSLPRRSLAKKLR